jgi:hypothetical protein
MLNGKNPGHCTDVRKRIPEGRIQKIDVDKKL